MTGAGSLAGRRVVVTRGLDKSDRLSTLLEEAGATVLRVPLITAEAIATEAEVRAALGRLRSGGESGRAWLVITSEIGVHAVAQAAKTADLAGVAVAVVGPATAAALRSFGVEPELVASGQEAESLASELAKRPVAGAAALVIAAAGGRNVVAPVLAAAGARVEVLEAYRTVMPDGAADQLRAAFAGRDVDAITFTSGSTVRHCAGVMADPPQQCVAVCIGPVTARAARDAGWTSIVTAVEHTAAGMAAVLTKHLGAAHPLP